MQERGYSRQHAISSGSKRRQPAPSTLLDEKYECGIHRTTATPDSLGAARFRHRERGVAGKVIAPLGNRPFTILRQGNVALTF
jgi:hypothetical protein